MKATTQQWLDLAKTDLRSCANNLLDDYVTNIVAFHSQQVVEKALKALLEEKEIPIPRAHNRYKRPMGFYSLQTSRIPG